ncbi:MAG: hypothetical protein ACKPKO_22440, partial [Candidatus Fonsibacter sp.]
MNDQQLSESCDLQGEFPAKDPHVPCQTIRDSQWRRTLEVQLAAALPGLKTQIVIKGVKEAIADTLSQISATVSQRILELESNSILALLQDGFQLLT